MGALRSGRRTPYVGRGMVDSPPAGNRTCMTEMSREFSCSPQEVFDVLDDGWLYASWVVGASRIRGVDAGWPAVGTKIHHSVGTWPMLIDDTSIVKAYDPPRMLTLQVRAWPAGEAQVVVKVAATSKGCLVTMSEDATAGPGKLIPGPVRHGLIGWRNREALRRLQLLSEGRKHNAEQNADIAVPHLPGAPTQTAEEGST